jgi:hypothetical protein
LLSWRLRLVCQGTGCAMDYQDRGGASDSSTQPALLQDREMMVRDNDGVRPREAADSAIVESALVRTGTLAQPGG